MDGRVPLTEASAFVLDQVAKRGFSDQGVETTTRTISRFQLFATRGLNLSFVDEVDVTAIGRFVGAPTGTGQQPSVATKHLRRTGVRLYFKILREFGMYAGDPTADLELPSRTKSDVRPLTDAEILLVRWSSQATLFESRQPAVVALAEATAVASEIPQVRVRDLELVNGTVRLPGCKTAIPRVATLTDWGLEAIHRRVEHLENASDGVLAYEGAGGSRQAQSAVTGTILGILKRAGLRRNEGVGSGSIRAWAGRRALEETGQIERAAQVLGCRSLDVAANIVGFEWDADH